jgi:uncharacterized protein (TIGR02246 family)
MRWIRTSLAAIALLTTAACASGPQAELAPRSDLRASIEAATAELAARGRANDMLAAASLYADDAVMLGPDGFRIEGRAAIDDYWKRMAGDVVDWQLETFEVRGNGDLAHQLGRSRLSLRDASGATQLSEVLFCVLWRRQESGAWRIAVDAYWLPAG